MFTKNNNLGGATICYKSHHPQNQKILRRYLWCQFGLGERVEGWEMAGAMILRRARQVGSMGVDSWWEWGIGGHITKPCHQTAWLVMGLSSNDCLWGCRE